MRKPQKNGWLKTRTGKVWLSGLVTLTVLNLALLSTGEDKGEPKDVPLSQAVAAIQNGDAIKAVVDDGQNKVVITLKPGTDTSDIELVDTNDDATETDPNKSTEPSPQADTPSPSAEPSAEPSGAADPATDADADAEATPEPAADASTEPTPDTADAKDDAAKSGDAKSDEATSSKDAAKDKVSFDPDAKPEGPQIAAAYPISYADTLTQILIEYKVPTKTEPIAQGSMLASLFFSLLPILLIMGLLLYFMRSQVGIGKLGKRGEAVGEVPEVRFTDVAGADEAVTELQELVEFLGDGSRFTKTGAKAPRGALLVGPPGTGKTLLARAVAGEAGVPFFALAGSDFVETFVGVGAKRVRDLFDKARKAGGAIIFIDEIDAVGRARGGSGSQQGGDTERENTLISMLNEMDGFDDGNRIIVLAATNRADVLDPALIRPGRLDRQIQVPAPDRRGREAILGVHARNKPIDEDVDFVSLARRTPGMSGAELEQVINEACMEAARHQMETVDQSCFDAAIATVALGRARTSALVTEHDRQITAWHEAGHTVAALVQEYSDDPVSVSIIPRGPAGGVTWMSGSDDVFLTRRKALAQLRVSLAGRAAEEVLLNGGYTQGAHGDLTSASNLAWAMVTKYGMSEAGYLVIADDTIHMGGPVADRAREHAEKLLADAHADATLLMAEHAVLLKAVAEALLDRETLTRAEISEIAARVADDAVAPVSENDPVPVAADEVDASLIADTHPED